MASKPGVGHGMLDKQYSTTDISRGASHTSSNSQDKEPSKTNMYAPKCPFTNPVALKFGGITPAQIHTASLPIKPKLEPLLCLKKYQDQKRPEYIYKRHLEFAEGMEAIPVEKKIKRTGSVEPLERLELVSPLPELPEHLRIKQEKMASMVTEPVEEPAKQPALGKVHATVPSFPLSTRPKMASNYEGLQDMEEIIYIIRTHPRIGFLYLTPAVHRSSIYYHYYNIKVVRYLLIDRDNYFTISQNGVVHNRIHDETEFIPLDTWEQEYYFFVELIKIPLFYLFRKWKAFTVWRHNVRRKKIRICRKALTENLFIVNAVSFERGTSEQQEIWSRR